MKRKLFPGLVGEMAKRGDTQIDLARILDISKQAVSRKFNGKNQWTFKEIEKLCEHYNKNYYELFKNEEQTN